MFMSLDKGCNKKMLRISFLLIAALLTTYTEAGIVKLKSDKVVTHITSEFTLESGFTAVYSETAIGTSNTVQYLSRDIRYYDSDNDGWNADTVAAFTVYDSKKYNLFTETEQMGDYGTEHADFALPEVVPVNKLPTVRAVVTLDWVFAVKEGPIVFDGRIYAENSFLDDSFIKLIDLRNHEVIYELIGGWGNRGSITLNPNRHYALFAQAQEINGDDDTETEVYFYFDRATQITSVSEPSALILLITGLAGLGFGRRRLS